MYIVINIHVLYNTIGLFGIFIEYFITSKTCTHTRDMNLKMHMYSENLVRMYPPRRLSYFNWFSL